MTRDDDADRVAAVRRANGPSLAHISKPTRLLAVRDGFGVGDPAQHLPDLLLKGRSARVQRQVEHAPSAVEVLVELSACQEQHRVGVVAVAGRLRAGVVGPPDRLQTGV